MHAELCFLMGFARVVEDVDYEEETSCEWLSHSLIEYSRVPPRYLKSAFQRIAFVWNKASLCLFHLYFCRKLSSQAVGLSFGEILKAISSQWRRGLSFTLTIDHDSEQSQKLLRPCTVLAYFLLLVWHALSLRLSMMFSHERSNLCHHEHAKHMKENHHLFGNKGTSDLLPHRSGMACKSLLRSHTDYSVVALAHCLSIASAFMKSTTTKAGS